MKAERYTLRESEKALLRALAGGCYFPNCPNPVMDTDTDHLTAYEHGGKTTLTNQRPACQRHHLLKHFKDDKTRHGHYRREHDPERTKIRLRGWKPLPTTNGTTAWLSPSGNYHRPQHHEPRPPAYPKWLKKRLNNALN
ncbi:HNH endonuclease signature motif containing protein, partial [Arthrobacter sp. E3]|uniref:HNH endonuclease signature motif containing protein n=1 Tax=Arthrobacter sp. E3 TaxID=517402 RepID=UPI001A93AA4E